MRDIYVFGLSMFGVHFTKKEERKNNLFFWLTWFKISESYITQ